MSKAGMFFISLIIPFTVQAQFTKGTSFIPVLTFTPRNKNYTPGFGLAVDKDFGQTENGYLKDRILFNAGLMLFYYESHRKYPVDSSMKEASPNTSLTRLYYSDKYYSDLRIPLNIKYSPIANEKNNLSLSAGVAFCATLTRRSSVAYYYPPLEYLSDTIDPGPYYSSYYQKFSPLLNPWLNNNITN